MSYVTADSGDNIEMIDKKDGSVTIALLRFTPTGITFQWMTELFNPNGSVPELYPMPDEVRQAIVETLRFHAARLESKEMDAQIAGLFEGAGVMAKFTKTQPKDGEVILHCGHPDVKPHHFFGLVPEAQFMRPDKSVGRSRWMVLCRDCFSQHAETPERCIRADDVWDGDAPAITENFN